MRIGYIGQGLSAVGDSRARRGWMCSSGRKCGLRVAPKTSATAVLGGQRFLVPVGDGPGLSLVTVTLRVPMLDSVTDTSSPSASGPTPDGVPVAITSPTSRVITVEM